MSRLSILVYNLSLTASSATVIPPTQSGPSPEDIKKVIADYHVREAKKAEAAKEQGKEDEKEKEGSKDAKDQKVVEIPSSPSIPVTSPPASHRKFALHRQIFDMRKSELRRRDQGNKAREVGKGLPQVPRGMF